MSEIDELLDIVGENNQIIGQSNRGEAYQKGLLHRAVHLFIVNSEGEILIQKRSLKKHNCPGAYDVSVAEHVKAGESFEMAAQRGLKEELGIEVPLVKTREIHRHDSTYQSQGKQIHDNELLETYLGRYDGDFQIDPEEVSEVNFWSIDEINQLLKDSKSLFTSWFVDEWNFMMNPKQTETIIKGN